MYLHSKFHKASEFFAYSTKSVQTDANKQSEDQKWAKGPTFIHMYPYDVQVFKDNITVTEKTVSTLCT